MHIAIAGNIGAGKTTLTRLLAKRYGWTPHYEPVDNNPYLEDYYGDMERWSFNLQIYFLNKRFRDVVAIAKSEETVIQDRTIFEDARIFAPNPPRQGTDERPRLRQLYRPLRPHDESRQVARPPYIYIRSSIPHLIEHIQRRGRDYEQTIRIDYLRGLGERYEEWIKTYQGPMIIIDGDKNDCRDFQRITEMIDERLYGLFPLDNKD